MPIRIQDITADILPSTPPEPGPTAAAEPSPSGAMVDRIRRELSRDDRRCRRLRAD